MSQIFDYYLPKDSDQIPKIGQRVLVPFGRREVIGFIHGVSDESSLPKSKIKYCKSIIDEAPLINKEAHGLISWCKNYYHYPLGKTYATAVPKYLRSGKTPAIESMVFQKSGAERKLTTHQKKLLTIVLSCSKNLVLFFLMVLLAVAKPRYICS